MSIIEILGGEELSGTAAASCKYETNAFVVGVIDVLVELEMNATLIKEMFNVFSLSGERINFDREHFLFGYVSVRLFVRIWLFVIVIVSIVSASASSTSASSSASSSWSTSLRLTLTLWTLIGSKGSASASVPVRTNTLFAVSRAINGIWSIHGGRDGRGSGFGFHSHSSHRLLN